MNEEVVYGDMWGFTHKKPIVEKPVDVPTWEKNSEENLEKDSPYHLLMFTWD